MLVQVFNSTIVSGPETLVVPALPLVRDQGVAVTVVLLCESRREAESRKVVDWVKSFGLPVREIWIRSRIDRKAVQEFSNLLEELHATIVHSHDVKASTYTLSATRISEKRGARNWKILSTHHGVRGRSGFKVKAYEWFYSRFILPSFDRVLAVCTSDRKLLVDRGLKDDQVIAHLNGVDRTLVPIAERPERSRQIRSQWKLSEKGITPDTVLVGFVGRLSPEKRLNRILEVVSLIEKSGKNLPNWRLVVFGSGALESELHQQCRDLGLDHRVNWMGYRTGLGNELCGFDIVISMSDAEGLPINLIEAGWGATPVFATQVDGNLDLMPNSDLGVLVPVESPNQRFADELTELIANRAGREKMGPAFQAHVARSFSGKRWVTDLISIYRGLEKS
ncbi:MAG: glycosyltransferase family 4 protein [Bdellovibrionales bacterium]|nr:glycosyltransferase family 4 protein [Bdellovibrionales bacterium]